MEEKHLFCVIMSIKNAEILKKVPKVLFLRVQEKGSLSLSRSG